MSAVALKEMSKSMVGYRSGGPKYCRDDQRPESRLNNEENTTDLVNQGITDSEPMTN